MPLGAQPISKNTLSTVRDPAGLFPFSGSTPFDTYNNTLAGLLGSYTGFTSGAAPINAAQTAGVALGNLLSTVTTGTDMYPMVLQAGTSSTAVPLVVQPADYNVATNAVIYNLVNWHAAALALEGLNGAGFLSAPAQETAPGAPSAGLRLYADSANNLAFVSAAGKSASISASALTAARIYALPNAAGNLVVDAATQNLSNKTFTTIVTSTVATGGFNAPLYTPASSAAAGAAGTVAWDADYIYVWTGTNTVKRALLSVF